MPVFKDYINAFRLACVNVAETQAFSPMQDDARASSYDQGYRYAIIAASMTFANKMDKILAQSEMKMPDPCFTQPEEAVLACLNGLAGEYQHKALTYSSRQLEEIFAKDKPPQDLTDSFNKNFPKLPQEHSAFDHGSAHGREDFFSQVLPNLISTYQKQFDPEDHPYSGRVKDEGAPKYRM